MIIYKLIESKWGHQLKRLRITRCDYCSEIIEPGQALVTYILNCYDGVEHFYEFDPYNSVLPGINFDGPSLREWFENQNEFSYHESCEDSLLSNRFPGETIYKVMWSFKRQTANLLLGRGMLPEELGILTEEVNDE